MAGKNAYVMSTQVSFKLTGVQQSVKAATDALDKLLSKSEALNKVIKEAKDSGTKSVSFDNQNMALKEAVALQKELNQQIKLQSSFVNETKREYNAVGKLIQDADNMVPRAIFELQKKLPQILRSIGSFSEENQIKIQELAKRFGLVNQQAQLLMYGITDLTAAFKTGRESFNESKNWVDVYKKWGLSIAGASQEQQKMGDHVLQSMLNIEQLNGKVKVGIDLERQYVQALKDEIAEQQAKQQSIRARLESGVEANGDKLSLKRINDLSVAASLAGQKEMEARGSLGAYFVSQAGNMKNMTTAELQEMTRGLQEFMNLSKQSIKANEEEWQRYYEFRRQNSEFLSSEEHRRFQVELNDLRVRKEMNGTLTNEESAKLIELEGRLAGFAKKRDQFMSLGFSPERAADLDAWKEHTIKNEKEIEAETLKLSNILVEANAKLTAGVDDRAIMRQREQVNAGLQATVKALEDQYNAMKKLSTLGIGSDTTKAETTRLMAASVGELQKVMMQPSKFNYEEIETAVKISKDYLQTQRIASEQQTEMNMRIQQATEYLRQQKQVETDTRNLTQLGFQKNEIDSFKQGIQVQSEAYRELRNISDMTLKDQITMWEKSKAAAIDNGRAVAHINDLLSQLKTEQLQRTIAELHNATNSPAKLSAMSDAGLKDMIERMKAFDLQAEKSSGEVGLFASRIKLLEEQLRENQRQPGIKAFEEIANNSNLSIGRIKELIEVLKKYRETLHELDMNEPMGIKKTDEAIKELELRLRSTQKISQGKIVDSNTLLPENEVKRIVDRYARMSPKLIKKDMEEGKITMQQLQQAFKQYTTALMDGTAKQKGFGDSLIKMAAQATNLDKRMKNMNNTFKFHASTLENAADRLKNYVLIYVGFQQAVDAIRGFISENLKLTDSMANVRKVSGLLDEEVLKLNEDLRGFNTRSTQDELMKLAYQGGKLGLALQGGEMAIRNFVQAGEEVTVALGEEFGGAEAATSLVKLGNAMGYTTDRGFKAEQILRAAGSAILDLGNKSVAGYKYTTQFATQIGAMGDAAGLTMPELLAIGATLDTMGSKSQSAATALSRFLSQLASKPQEVAKALKLSGDDLDYFNKTMAQGKTMDAVVFIFDYLNRNKANLKDITNAMKGLTGSMNNARTKSLLSSLANASDELQRLRDISQRAFDEALDGTASVTEAYELMNNTGQAGIERFGNAFNEIFVNGPIGTAIGKVAMWFAEMMENIDEFKGRAIATIISITVAIANATKGIIASIQGVKFAAVTLAASIRAAFSAIGWTALISGITMAVGVVYDKIVKWYNWTKSTTVETQKLLKGTVQIMHDVYKAGSQEYTSAVVKDAGAIDFLFERMKQFVKGSKDYIAVQERIKKAYGDQLYQAAKNITNMEKLDELMTGNTNSTNLFNNALSNQMTHYDFIIKKMGEFNESQDKIAKAKGLKEKLDAAKESTEKANIALNKLEKGTKEYVTAENILKKSQQNQIAVQNELQNVLDSTNQRIADEIKNVQDVKTAYDALTSSIIKSANARAKERAINTANEMFMQQNQEALDDFYEGYIEGGLSQKQATEVAAEVKRVVDQVVAKDISEKEAEKLIKTIANKTRVKYTGATPIGPATSTAAMRNIEVSVEYVTGYYRKVLEASKKINESIQAAETLWGMPEVNTPTTDDNGNTGMGLEGEDKNKDWKQKAKDRYNAYIKELDDYYVRRQMLLDDMRGKEELSDIEYNHRTENIERQHLLNRAKLRNMFMEGRLYNNELKNLSIADMVEIFGQDETSGIAKVRGLVNKLGDAFVDEVKLTLDKDRQKVLLQVRDNLNKWEQAVIALNPLEKVIADFKESADKLHVIFGLQAFVEGQEFSADEYTQRFDIMQKYAAKILSLTEDEFIAEISLVDGFRNRTTDEYRLLYDQLLKFRDDYDEAARKSVKEGTRGTRLNDRRYEDGQWYADQITLLESYIQGLEKSTVEYENAVRALEYIRRRQGIGDESWVKKQQDLLSSMERNVKREEMIAALGIDNSMQLAMSQLMVANKKRDVIQDQLNYNIKQSTVEWERINAMQEGGAKDMEIEAQKVRDTERVLALQKKLLDADEEVIAKEADILKQRISNQKEWYNVFQTLTNSIAQAGSSEAESKNWELVELRAKKALGYVTDTTRQRTLILKQSGEYELKYLTQEEQIQEEKRIAARNAQADALQTFFKDFGEKLSKSISDAIDYQTEMQRMVINEENRLRMLEQLEGGYTKYLQTEWDKRKKDAEAAQKDATESMKAEQAQRSADAISMEKEITAAMNDEWSTRTEQMLNYYTEWRRQQSSLMSPSDSSNGTTVNEDGTIYTDDSFPTQNLAEVVVSASMPDTEKERVEAAVDANKEILSDTKKTNSERLKSNKKLYNSLTQMMNLYGMTYSIVTNSNMSADEKWQMAALSVTGSVINSLLSVAMEEAVAKIAVSKAEGTAKAFGMNPWLAAGIIAAMTAAIGLAMGAATNAVSKAKSNIQSITGASGGRLVTGMLTYASGQYETGRNYLVRGNDGKSYNATYEGRNPDTGIRKGEHFGIFSEVKPEMIIDGDTTERMMKPQNRFLYNQIMALRRGNDPRMAIDYSYVYGWIDKIKAVNYAGRRNMAKGMPTFATGNMESFYENGTYDNGTIAQSNILSQDNSERDTEMLNAIQTLNERLSSPIPTYINMYGKDGLLALIRKGERFEARNGKTS